MKVSGLMIKLIPTSSDVCFFVFCFFMGGGKRERIEAKLRLSLGKSFRRESTDALLLLLLFLDLLERSLTAHFFRHCSIKYGGSKQVYFDPPLRFRPLY